MAGARRSGCRPGSWAPASSIACPCRSRSRSRPWTSGTSPTRPEALHPKSLFMPRRRTPRRRATVSSRAARSTTLRVGNTWNCRLRSRMCLRLLVSSRPALWVTRSRRSLAGGGENTILCTCPFVTLKTWRQSSLNQILAASASCAPPKLILPNSTTAAGLLHSLSAACAQANTAAQFQCACARTSTRPHVHPGRTRERVRPNKVNHIYYNNI
jgi:hypothetical protein